MKDELLLKDFTPKQMLETKSHCIQKPKYPVIDAHNHLGSMFGHTWADRPLKELITHMDRLNIEKIIDLDGGFGNDILKKHLEHFKANEPERFIHFGGIDFSLLKKGEKVFHNHINTQLEKQKEQGIQGIKIWKNLGLRVLDKNEQLIRVNDEVLNPLWDKASELDLPVMIHVADPLAFFEPIDTNNERYEELINNPDWHFPKNRFPLFQSIISNFYDMVKNNPKTIFIGAHVGCYAENLSKVSETLDLCKNFYVDTSARLGELGRQPYSSKEFFTKYQDRILFGTDMGMDPQIYKNYFRFFETFDENFNYDSDNPPTQGRWCINGIGLEDKILEKIYYKNIKKILKI